MSLDFARAMSLDIARAMSLDIARALGRFFSSRSLLKKQIENSKLDVMNSMVRKWR